MNEDLEQSRIAEADLQITIRKAQELLQKVDEQSSFTMTAILAAQCDDRSAFERLCVWGNDTNYSMRGEALKLATAIKIAYWDPKDTKTYAQPKGPLPKPIDSFSFQEIEEVWNMAAPIFAKHLVMSVWSNTNITQVQKLSFLYSVVTKDSKNSLSAADKAARLLSGEIKADYVRCFECEDIKAKWTEWIKIHSSTNISTQTNVVPGIGGAPH